MSESDAAWGDLIADAEYVLGELARGEIPCMADPTVVMTSDKLLDAVNQARANPTSRDAVGKVEKALAATMVLLSPITVKTLRDTDGALASVHEVEHGRLSPLAWLSYHIFGDRPAAYKFSTAFSVLSVLIVIAALVSGLLDHKAAAVRADHRSPVFHQRAVSAGAANNAGANTGTTANADKTPAQTAMKATPAPAPDLYSDIAHALAPFAYGAMGACVFLLRSLHKHIWGRTFDRRRKPEYYSRVLLGAISGGTIVLLLTSEAAGPEGAIKLGYNALGFLAGYNTDLLFSTIERIMNAILPKTPTTAPASPTPILVPPGGLANPPKKPDDSAHPKDGDGSVDRAPDNKPTAAGKTDTFAPAKDAASPVITARPPPVEG